MADETPQQKEQKKQGGSELFARIFYIFGRFSWFFGILIALIVLVSTYRFIIQPQYQRIIAQQAELERLNLEGERQALSNHIVQLESFITLSETITQEDKNNLERLLQDAPDLLVLQIQFEKFLEQYNTENPQVIFGEPSFTLPTSNEQAAPAEARESIIDLSGFFDEPATQETTQQSSSEQPQIVLGTIPVDITITFNDYFLAKDFIRDVEALVPLIDIKSLSIGVTQSVSNTEGEGEEGGGAAVTLSGVMHIATEQ